jgi:hypothetical protein
MKTNTFIPRLFILSLFCLGFALGAGAQGVLVGDTAQPPHSSAAFEIRSNQRGFLLPRLTTSQRNNINGPAIGLEIYNVTSECVEVYFPTGWKPTQCNCTQAPSSPSLNPSVYGYYTRAVAVVALALARSLSTGVSARGKGLASSCKTRRYLYCLSV